MTKDLPGQWADSRLLDRPTRVADTIYDNGPHQFG